MTETLSGAHPGNKEKFVGKGEFILYLVAVFFYTSMTGMLGSYRSAYLVNVLRLESSQTSFFNTVISIVPFVIHFFISMYIDNRKIGKSGKFRPLVAIGAVPAGVFLMLSFITPGFIIKAGSTVVMAYILTVALGFAVATQFTGNLDTISMVMTPNMKERDTVMSFRSISSAVGNSAPLVIVLVIGLIWRTRAHSTSSARGSAR